MARVETMSISNFMAGSTDWRREQTKLEKVFKKGKKRIEKVLRRKGLAMSALLPLVAGVSFSNHALASSTEIEVASVGNALNGVVADKIIHAFDPLIGLLQAVAHPLCLLGMMAGCVFWMLNMREKGLALITNAGIGYILLQLAPFLMDMLVEITKSL